MHLTTRPITPRQGNSTGSRKLATGSRANKARASGIKGCVEVARFTRILVRDSKDPGGPVLAYTVEEVAAFLDGAKKGEFDDLV